MEMSQGIARAIFPDWIKVLFWGMPSAQVRHVGNNHSDIAVTMLEAPTSKRRNQRFKTIDLVLPTQSCLSRNLTLPPTNHWNLMSMAAMDLTRKTPFQEAEISWALLPAHSEQDGTHIQYIAKIKDLDSYRENLMTHGFLVRRFLIGTRERKEILADYVNQVAPNRRRIRILNTFLASVTAFILLFGWLYPAVLARQDIAALKVQNQQLQQEALNARQALEQIEQAEAAQRSFLNTLTSRRRAADDLRQISVVLPDTAWISDLTLSDNRILMAGETSETAAELILEIAESSLKLEPSLNGAVSRTNEGRERFNLVLTKANP